MEYGQVKNPKTGRYIYIGGQTYKNLLKQYDESFLLSDAMITKKPPKSPSILKYDLFSKYVIESKAVDYGKEACIYKAHDDINTYAIRIINDNHELQIYQLLNPISGFVHMIKYYQLPYLPSVFEACKNIKKGKINIYILEWIDESLETVLPIMSNQDKYNFLYHLLSSLKAAKVYGFQHNDIYYGNIRVKDLKPILIDFGKATIDMPDDKLKGKDYVSFYNLLNYMAFDIKDIRYLTVGSKNKGVLFDTLLNKIVNL